MTKKQRHLIWLIAAIFFALTFIIGIIFNYIGSIMLMCLIAYVVVAWVATYPSARREELEAQKKTEDEQRGKTSN